VNALTAVRPTEFEQQALEEVDPRIREAALLEAARVILSRLDRDLMDTVRQRQSIEQRWIRNLRQFLGKYDDTLFTLYKNAGQSHSFVNITRPKTNGWVARIFDMLFPTDDRNWGIGPTPIPTLSGKAKEAEAAAIAAAEQANQAADAAAQAAQQGNPQAAADVDAQAGQIAEQAKDFAAQVREHRAAIEEAKRRAEWMERTIEDQLVEADYVGQCRDVIEDGCKLGTGILKGPTTVQALRGSWAEVDGAGPDGQPKKSWAMQQDPDPRPMSRRVNPWFFYPDMSATTIGEAEFTFELSLPSRKDLKRAARKLGFNKEAVGRLLEEGPPQQIDSVLTHLKEIRALTGEDEGISGRYMQWEYNGPLECEEICGLLRALGRDDDARRFEAEKDPLEEYRVILWFCGNEVLKIAPEYPLDSGDGLYSVWCFEKSEASIFGIGCPEMLADPQETLNNAWRMMLDNGALSVGPQILINKGMVLPEDGNWQMLPMKVWLLSSTAFMSPGSKPFDVFNITNNQQELAGIIELAKQFADAECSLPDLAQGEQGSSSQTLGGMSILFNSANVVFRQKIKNWDDDLTKPTIRRIYDWNMQFNPDDSIKGDMHVDARGTSVLLVREIQSQNLMAIMSNWPSHPVIAPWINVEQGIKKTFQTMMIPPDDLMRTKEEVEAEQAKQAQQQPAEDPKVADRQAADRFGAGHRQDAGGAGSARHRVPRAHRPARISGQAGRGSGRTGLSQQEIETRAGIEHGKIDSKERLHAVDIAVEDQRAQAGGRGFRP
jgi:hypothetical protein